MIVLHRRGNKEEWVQADLLAEQLLSIDPSQVPAMILKDGEFAIEELGGGVRHVKVGDGHSKFSDLPYIDTRAEKLLTNKLSETKAALDKKINDASSQLNTLVQGINNTLSATTNKLSHDLTEVTTKVDANRAALARSIVIEEAERITADNSIISTVTEYITKIYAELADLVDDDILILEKAFSIENKLTAKINELSIENIAGIEQLITEKITEVTANVDEAITAATSSLSENLENLRSNTNLKFTSVQSTLDNLAAAIQTTKTDITEQFAAIEESVTANKLSVDESVNSLIEQLLAVDGRIDETNAAVELQSKRISNLISLEPGSTTGDAELIDIRSGYNGLTHLTAGDAVRAIGNDLEALKNSLPDYIPSNAVDGLLYENSQLYLTSKGETVGEPVTITGGSGGGGSISIVKVTNNLPSNAIAVSKGNPAWIDFTYTSFENDVATGDGSMSITINNKVIDALSGAVQHGVAKRINIADHLKAGLNTVKITCFDQYGATRSLVYSVTVIELKIESQFDATRIYSDTITFRYKVYGQVEKYACVLLDGEEYSKIKLSASVSGNETTLVLPKQSHGCHKITAFVTATVNDDEVRSNILEYEIICTEPNDNTAMISSTCNTAEVTQGDLISIPYMVYDPVTLSADVELIIYSQIAGELIEVDRLPITVGRGLQYWSTRKYPVGKNVFTISYTYNLYGVETTITKSHTITANALDIDVTAETDSLQLFLSAQGRTNAEQNPAVWSFTSVSALGQSMPEVTTTFSNFNWKSNGWVIDDNGDTCLRINGDARAVINFKPFENDFKLNGKTIEFEFAVRDVNSRDTTVISCFNKDRGFLATPDTAYLQSAGTKVSCNYKDEERIRVAVSVEHADSLSRFVAIYLDGVLSGVQRYATTDNFSQDNPVNITLGSNLCGLDIYSIRIYDKALSTPQMLENYIADQADPTTKLKLFTDNDVLDEDGKVSYDRVKALGQLPIITFTGQMPTYKGDKKKKSVRMKFEDPANPDLNFDVLLDQIDVQGTSSQYYVRKNWKVKLPEARPHMPGAIPAKVFCIKVDYAEATGTHNTGSANYIETLYDRNEAVLPPQKDDTRVRTTVQGFPCILFEKATEDSDPVFSSKANFNYDKDAENAFGFTDDYEDFGVECWEFCNNTSDSCNFAGAIQPDWQEDFEPRYVPESANFERIEELLEIKELAANGKATMTELQKTELATLQANCIANFKAMHDWVLSTATYKIVDGSRVPIVPTPLATPITYGGVIYTEDNEEYRLAKFKHEFENYFNLHYTSIYYVFTFFALMVDQRAKNLFLTRWKDDDGKYRWYPYFYDNDTIFGINNEGALVFTYSLEDIDQLGSSNVYNGQNSILWNNFRICFPQQIKETYAALRSDKKLTYDAIINNYVTNHSDKWSAAVYNEDAEYKYITMARQLTDKGDVDASNLYQVRGPGEHHLRYFIANRLNYCDSKWFAGDYPADYIFLRIYTPTLAAITDDMSEEKKAEIEASNARITASLNAVPANPNITLTPFSDMYAGVRYMAGGITQQARLASGESHEFAPPLKDDGSTITFNDTETAIYGASELSSLGDLSGLYCGVISLGSASKLVEIKLGNESTDYHNDNFREIAVGSNRLLKRIDLRNCSGLGIAGENPQKTLELSNCPNIEEIYTEGTNLESVDLPDSGYIKILHLPASTTTLNIKNQQYIEDFSVVSYSNIRTLCIENCPTLNTNEILEACSENGRYTVERVRLTGINWSLDDAEFIKTLFPRFDADGNIIGGIRGIDEKNNNMDDAYLVGTCHIKKLTGADYAEIKSHYPYLTITFDEMTSKVTFSYSDSNGVAHVEEVPFTSKNSQLGNLSDYSTEQQPAWPENEAFTYEHVGWSRRQQISNGVNDTENDYLAYIQADALIDIVGDRILYPVFKANRKSYPVTFINASADNLVLAVVVTPYGSDAVYTGEPPKRLDAASPDLYEHVGWHPAPINITGPLTCYAQFAVLDDVWYTIVLGDITDCEDNSGKLFNGYTLNKTANTMKITECKNDLNMAVRIPEKLAVENVDYSIKSVKGFASHVNLELIDLPETLEILDEGAFKDCNRLFEITLPRDLTTIKKEALMGCLKLKEITIPSNVSNIDVAAFTACPLERIAVADENPIYEVINNCLIKGKGLATGKTLIKGLSSSTIPNDGSIGDLLGYCFANTNITNVYVPDNITTISNNAFSRCDMLTELHLPEALEILDATCFAWCYSLENVVLPAKLREIRTYAFNSCALKTILIPATVTRVLENAFGNMPSLKTVTFEKRVDEYGNIIVPYIHKSAFINSGNNEIVFNVPWSKDYDYNYTEQEKLPDGGTVDKKIDPTGWGAKNFIINYDYVEA